LSQSKHTDLANLKREYFKSFNQSRSPKLQQRQVETPLIFQLRMREESLVLSAQRQYVRYIVVDREYELKGKKTHNP